MNSARTARLCPGVFFCWMIFALAGCASAPVMRLTDPAFPPYAELTASAFFPQEQYQCGPAALATVLHAAGVEVTPEALAAHMYLPGRSGSLQLELLGATRRQERVPYLLAPQLDAVLHEIAAGNVVLVLQNLGFAWLPVWHYAVVIGFDLAHQEMILRSGREARHIVSVATFERTWARGEHWAMVVAPPGKVPATANELEFISAIAVLETQQRYAAAEQAYTAALQRWPDSNTAAFGLGNSQFGLRAYAQAEHSYRQFLERQPRHAAAWNNLAQTLFAQQRWADAEAAAQTSLDLGGVTATAARATLEEIRQQQAPAHPIE